MLAPQTSVRDVVLLDPPRRLELALHAALTPWGRHVESVSRATPAPTLPGTALAAAALARELGAQAVVWLSTGADGSALWIYEVSKDTITARPIPTRPMNQAFAAALALTVKTWLRSAEPTSELGAPELASAPPAVLSPRPASADASVSPGAPAPDIDTDGAARWQFLVHGAARRGAYRPTSVEPRFGVEVRVAPWSSEHGTTRLWIGVRGEVGNVQALGVESFRGVHSEWAGALSVGAAQWLSDAFGVALHVGAALRHGSLSGTLLANGRGVERRDLGVALQFRPEAELGLGSLGVVLQPSLGVSLDEVEYTAETIEVLETERVWWALGAAVRLNAF